MEDKAVIINRIIKEVEGTHYLELGYGTGHNFKQIECDNKLSVDINGKADFKGTTNEFFEQNEADFNVIFIDSDHIAEQVRKDISNALKCSPKAIILHDSLPPTEAHQIVPRQQKQWCGDVWRAAVGFHKEYPDVKFETYKSNYGLTCIYPEGKKVRKHFEDTETSWEYFKKNAKKFLNIVD